MLNLRLICLSVLEAILLSHAYAGVDPQQIPMPLQRVSLSQGAGYTIAQELDGDRVFAVLVNVSTAARVRLGDSYVLLYRGAVGIEQNQSAMRQQTLPWSLTDGVLFVGMHGRGIHTPGTLSELWRFPVGSDAVRPESRYCGLDPVSNAWQRLVIDAAGPVRLLAEYPKEVFYDLNASDGKRVEMFVSVDGQFTKWVFDGETWKHVRAYPLQVTGPFLISNDGRSIVAERDGEWALIRDLEQQNPQIQALIERTKDEPLTLVEDKVEQKNFFLHRDRLLDDTGRELFTARAARDHTDRLRKVIDFVVSGRAPRP